MSTSLRPEPNISPRTILIGAVSWFLLAQYFVVEFIAQRAWGTVPYSMQHNTISDLGATTCFSIPWFYAWQICSPLHPLMNASFIVGGLLTIVGLYFLRPIFPREWPSTLAQILLVVGALGSIEVGLIPENIVPQLHTSGAFALLILTNIGILLLGLSLYYSNWPRNFALATIFAGALGLAAFVHLPLGAFPQVGLGLIERFAAYPPIIWFVAAGIYFYLYRNDLAYIVYPKHDTQPRAILTQENM